MAATPFGALPTGLSTSTESTTFHYGPDRQYYKQEYSGPGGTEVTHYVGGILEKVYDGSTEDWRHTIRAGGQVVAIVSRKASGPIATHYALGDNQGSGSTLVDDAGTGYVRQSYGAFGLPRDGNDWDGAVPSGDQNAINAITRRGYTGHSMLGDMGLIHMNGRVHDAILGRFLSPDPYVPNPGFTQSYNRYAYVNNNPLSFIDPSGFSEQGVSQGVLDVLQEVLVSGSPEGCGRLTGYENSACLALVGWIEALDMRDLMCLMVGGLACSQDHFAQAAEPEEQYAAGGTYSGGPRTRVARGASRSQPAPSTALSTQPQGQERGWVGPPQGGTKGIFEDAAELLWGPGKFKLAGMLLGIRGAATTVSRISESPRLIRGAETAGRSVQQSIDRLTEQLSRGNLNPGIGTKPIGRGISEARARDGARVYFRQTPDGTIEILGKSNKANQQAVIDEVLQVFGN